VRFDDVEEKLSCRVAGIEFSNTWWTHCFKHFVAEVLCLWISAFLFNGQLRIGMLKATTFEQKTSAYPKLSAKVDRRANGVLHSCEHSGKLKFVLLQKMNPESIKP
jgi:hypothetical protein